MASENTDKLPPASLRELFQPKKQSRPFSIYALRGGVRFAQEPLEYFELVETMELLSGQLAGFVGNLEKLGEMIDRLKREELLPRLMRLVLKPYAPTLTARIANRLLAWRHRVKLDNPAAAMTGPEIAGVMLDFFLYNISWIVGFKNLQTASSTNSAMDKTWTMAEVFSLAWKLCTQPAAETSPEQTPSDASTPNSSAAGS